MKIFYFDKHMTRCYPVIQSTKYVVVVVLVTEHLHTFQYKSIFKS